MKIATACPCCNSASLTKSPAVLMPFVASRVFGWEPVTVTAEWGLQTIPDGSTYTPCNTVTCQKCGFVFCDIRFDDDEMHRLYNDYRGEEYTAQRERYEPGYTERNNKLNSGHKHIQKVEEFIRPYIETPLHILDFGGDTGINTPFQREAEIHHIYDIGTKPVVDGAVKVTELQQNYNLIVCAHVLEHLPHPADTLWEIVQILGAGLLYIEVPYENTNNKRHWHEHINCFTIRAMAHLLLRCGLRVEAWHDEMIDGGKVLQVVCKRKDKKGLT